MRLALGLVALLALLWSGYWVVGATAKNRALTAWFEDRRADGWVAEYRDIAVRGFPNRFDTTISGLDLADPETGVAWRAPFFQLFALSYRPNHVIAVWPPEQSVASPYETVTVAAADMRASVVFEPDTQLALDRSTMELDSFRLTGDSGWESGVARAVLATRRDAARANHYDIAFEATGVRPAEATRRALDPTGFLPNEVQRMALAVTMGFDAPWNRAAIEERRPAVTAVELDDLTAIWGDLELRATGTLAVDAAGYPEGRITVKAQNWREMLAIAVAAGALPQGLADTLERGLAVMAGMSGHPDTLDAPLDFAGRRVSLGPIPLGPAPRLRLR
jgi:hypothetical protein